MKVFASLDVGTSKIVALIGELDSQKELHVMSKGEVPSRGVDRGSIIFLRDASHAIGEAIKEVYRKSAFDISDVILGISSSKMISQNDTEGITLTSQSNEITEEHINKLLEAGRNKLKQEGYDILHIIPKRYKLDDAEGIINPLGLVGSKLSVDLHAIKVPTTVVLNMKRAVEEAHVGVSDTVPNIIASAEAVLLEEEKDAGVLLIDIGAGLTDFILYRDGSPEVVGSVNLAGINITKDILQIMKLPFEDAERLKKEHGYALTDLIRNDELISIYRRGEDKEITINKSEIANIIQARLEEIMERVVSKLEDANVSLDYANAGIVITGGTANLKGIKEFAERYFSTSVRIGRPINIGSIDNSIKDPAYATAVGLLIHKVRNLDKQDFFLRSNNGIRRREGAFVNRIKKFFEDIKNML